MAGRPLRHDRRINDVLQRALLSLPVGTTRVTVGQVEFYLSDSLSPTSQWCAVTPSGSVGYSKHGPESAYWNAVSPF